MATLLGQLHHEDEDTVVLQDIGKCSSNDTSSHCRGLHCSSFCENRKYCDIGIVQGPYFAWPILLVTSCQPV